MIENENDVVGLRKWWFSNGVIAFSYTSVHNDPDGCMYKNGRRG